MYPTTQLRRLARIRNGADHSGVQDDFGNFPVYGSGGEFTRATRALYSGPAVLLGRKGTINKPILVDGEFWTVDTMFCAQPNPGVDPTFLYYACTTIPFDMLSTSTALPSMTQGDLNAVRLPEPNYEAQQAITAFLDRETAKIDALIAKQEQLIATLREDQDAAWSADFNRLRDSAPLVPVRRVIESIVDGPFGSSLTSAHYTNDGARVIRLGNIGINEFKDEDHAYVSLDYAQTLSAHAVQAGDVIVAGLGDERMPLGRATVAPPQIGPAIVKADCYRVRPKPLLTADYLAWALSAPPTRTQMALLARGSTRARLNTTVVREVTIPVPPLHVQEEIVDQSRIALDRIDALIRKSTEMVATLREYRSALVTDAVTGKIDVRGVA